MSPPSAAAVFAAISRRQPALPALPLGFRLRLVAFFLVLSLPPLLAAFWGFAAVAKRSETRRVDARLQAGLRAATAAYENELAAAAREGAQLAATPALRDAVRRRDRLALHRLLSESPGEEFALVLPGADLDGAGELAERVRAALERRLILAPDGSRIAVTASFGVSAVPQQTTAAALLQAADAALYAAKRQGRNRVATAAAVA